MEYNQLKLLYEKIYTISLEIRALIESGHYDDILLTASRKDKLLAQLEEVKNGLPEENEWPSEIKEMFNKIKLQELENMEKLEAIKGDIKKELEKISKENRLTSTYSPIIQESTIVDIRE